MPSSGLTIGAPRISAACSSSLAASRQDHDLLSAVQDVGGLREIRVVRQPRAVRLELGGVPRDVPLRPLSVDLALLQVDRKGDMRYAAIEQCRPARQVRDVLDMCRPHDSRVVLRDIHEELVELDVLLREGADEVVKGHPRDRQHRLAVEFRVVQPVQQMNAAGT